MAPTNTITIQVNQVGAQQVTRAIEDIGRGASGAATSVRLLQGVLATLGIGAGLHDIVNMLSAFQGMQNQIQSVTEGLNVQSAAFERLAQVANAARQPLESHVQLYQRISFASADLKLSQEEIIKVTQAVGAALTIQNASAESARIIINELSRAFVEGTVTSRDWMALIRNAPQIIGLMARAMHDMANTDVGFKLLSRSMAETDVQILKASSSTSILKYLLDQGKISSEAFTKALLQIQPALQATLDKLPTTIAQAFVVLENKLVVVVGRLGEITGVSKGLADAILFVANHLDEIRKGAETAAIALAVAFGPGMVSNVAKLSAGLALLVVRNPWIALLGAIGAVVGAIVSFDRDSRTANVSVGLLRQGLDLVTEAARTAGTALAGAFGKSSFEEFVRSGLQTMRELFGSGIPLIAGMIGGAFDYVLVGIRNRFQDVLNLLIAGFNKLPGVNISPIPTAGRMTPDEAFRKGFSGTYDYISHGLEDIGKKWDDLARRAEKAGRDSGAGYASGVQDSLGPLKFQGTGGQQGPTISGAPLDASDKSNSYQIAQVLKEVGANETAIAGFLANFQRESGFDPTRVNKESGATNIAQWLGDRLTALRAIGPEKELATGLQLLRQELLGKYSGVLASANAAGSGAEAARVVADRFEVFGKPGAPAYEAEVRKRQELATGYLGGEVVGGPQSNPLTNQPPEGPGSMGRKELDIFTHLNQASEIAKATREMEEFERVSQKAAAIGLLTINQVGHGNTVEEERARLIGIVTGKLQDQINPLGALLRPLQEQIKSTAELDPVARAAGAAVDKMTESLRKQGVPLNEATQKWLKEYVLGLERIKAVQTEMDGVFKSSSQGALQTFSVKLEALNKLLADGRISVDEYTEAWAKAKADVLEKSDSMFDGIEAGLLRVSAGFGTESKIWSDAVQAVFSTTEKWVETLVTTGKGKFAGLMKSIEGDLAKAAFKGALKELFGLGEGGGGGGAGTGSRGGGLLGSVFGTGIRGAAGGGGAGGGGGGFGALSGVFGPAGNAVGGSGGLLGNLFSGGDKGAKETALGDYWLSYAQGLKDKGADVQMGLKEAGINAEGMGALKADASFWGGAGEPGLLGGIGDWFRNTFATGGQFFVPGGGGTDTVPVQFMATPGERVTIETPSQRMGVTPQRRGFADGGDFVAGSNFTAPGWVPDHFTDEARPFLNPAGFVAAPPPPGPPSSASAESAAIWAARSRTPEFAAEMARLQAEPGGPGAARSTYAIENAAAAITGAAGLARLGAAGLGSILGGRALAPELGALSRAADGSITIGGRPVDPRALLSDPFAPVAAPAVASAAARGAIDVDAPLTAAELGRLYGAPSAVRAAPASPAAARAAAGRTVGATGLTDAELAAASAGGGLGIGGALALPFRHPILAGAGLLGAGAYFGGGDQGLPTPSIPAVTPVPENLAPTVGTPTSAGGIAPPGGGRAALNDLVGRIADQTPSDAMAAVAAATTGVGTSADAVNKAAAQGGDAKANTDKAARGKGLGGWGWAAIAAAALAAGGGLAWYLTHRKKPPLNPAYNTGAWPNAPGAFPTAASYPGSPVAYAPSWSSPITGFHAGMGTPPAGFAEGGDFDVPDINDFLSNGIASGPVGTGIPSIMGYQFPEAPSFGGSASMPSLPSMLGSVPGTLTGMPGLSGSWVPSTPPLPTGFSAGEYDPTRSLAENATNPAGIERAMSMVGPGMMVGVKGAAALAGGGTTGMLAAARDLKAGMPAEEVWAKHGWMPPELTADRMWRSEVSDANAKVLKGFGTEGGTWREGNETLGSVLSHPELYRAYPELASMPVRGFLVDSAERAGAAYSPGMGIPGSRLGSISVDAGPGGNVRGTLLHEAQHAVQHIEGFGRGASPGEFLASGAVDTVAGADLAYIRTSGEVEARMTASRADLSAGQRRLLPPWEAGNPYGPDIPLGWQQYRGTDRGGFAGGGGFMIPEEPRTQVPPWMTNEDYSAPKGQYLPGAAALAQRGALTIQEPIGLPPKSFLESLGGMVSGAGSFISKGLFGADTSSIGGAGGLLGGLFSGGGQFTVGKLQGFADGGSFDVGGFGGTDNTLVAFKASPGEHVAVTPPVNATRGGSASSGGVTNIHNWNVETPDANSFMRSSGQIATKVGLVVDRQTRRNS